MEINSVILSKRMPSSSLLEDPSDGKTSTYKKNPPFISCPIVSSFVTVFLTPLKIGWLQPPHTGYGLVPSYFVQQTFEYLI